MNKYLQPHNLERYSFLWSEARLLVAALALFMGGVPPLLLLAGSGSFSLVWLVLKISWFISGAASIYLLYRWYSNGQRLFGGKNTYDTAAFLVSVISGLNLGVTGLLGRNIGMSLSTNSALFILTALVYVVVAFYLYKRWKASGEKIVS